MRSSRLITLLVLVLAVSPALGESLVDIKLKELTKPVNSRWGKDPFIRLMDKAEGAMDKSFAPGFEVEGIMTGGTKALAIIDGGFYRPGDVIDGYVIEGIFADRVALRKGGRTYTLKIQGFTFTKPAEEAGR